MKTESELRQEVIRRDRLFKHAEMSLKEAKEELNDFRSKPKIQVYQNMPVIVDGNREYAKCLDSDGTLLYYPDGTSSYTETGNIYSTKSWQPDYYRPSLLTWRPVDETIPDHDKWLVKNQSGEIHYKMNNRATILHFCAGCECLPLYEDK